MKKINSWLLVIIGLVVLLVASDKMLVHQKQVQTTEIDSSFTTFHMDGGIYPANIDVIITCNKEDAYNYINYNVDSTITKEYINECDGITISDKLNFTVWLESAKLTPDDIAIINHELFHVVRVIMLESGIPLNEYTNEAYAYELGYITKSFFNNLAVRK